MINMKLKTVYFFIYACVATVNHQKVTFFILLKGMIYRITGVASFMHIANKNPGLPMV